jgi:hypothetical protein
LGSAIGFLPSLAGATGWHPSERVVYDNIPSPAPGNVPSIGFAATSTSEFGGQVGLDGSARKDPTVKVLMSSWACKSGTWNAKNCITNPGSTFTHPVTLNVYEVGDNNSAGDLITSETKTFTMPYRPTADDGTNCNGANAGKWWDGENCNNGKAFKIEFDLDRDVVLPDQVILGVAYNTSNYGESPLGNATACYSTPQGCSYDSLNVGTNPSPTKGQALPSENDAYQNSTWTGAYCDNGAGGVGTFRLDAGCWTGFLPAFEVSAQNGGRYNHHGHHHHHHGSWWNKPGHNDNREHRGDKGRYNHKSEGFYSFWNR